MKRPRKRDITQRPNVCNFIQPGISFLGGGQSLPSNANADPYFDNVVLLIHGEGAQNSSTFVDFSKYNHAVTLINSPIVDTTHSPFNDGLGAISLNGTSALQFADAPELRLDTSVAWTIEAMINVASFTGYQCIAAKRQNSNSASYEVDINSNGYPIFYNSTLYTASSVVPLSQFNHVATTLNSGTIYQHLNGVLIGSYVATASSDYGAVLSIGGEYGAGGYAQLVTGYLAEVRITKDYARYGNANFTPPTQRFGNSGVASGYGNNFGNSFGN